MSSRIILVAAALVTAGLVFPGCERVPTQLSQVTWETMRDVRRDGVETAAPEIWNEAVARYDSAWLVITTENRQWFFERDYEPAESLLVRAGQSARLAAKTTRQFREQKSGELDAELEAMRLKLEDLRIGLNHNLAHIPLRQALTRAELKVKAADEAFTVLPVELTDTIFMEARAAMVAVEDRINDDGWVDEGELPNWRHMVDETVAWTKRTDSTALVVIKMIRKAYLLRGGKIVADYPVEFGYRSWKQKLSAGDASTPEGTYCITKSRERGSRYYKALVLNYPNDQDRRRFERNRKAGRIPRNARIGGNIEIHGEGGKGRDWTEGCVALTNPDMDRLMTRMGVGDRVTIVRQVDGWPQ